MYICIDNRIQKDNFSTQSSNLLIFKSLASNMPTNQQKTTAPEPNEIVRVSISEAARLFGVSTQTIRRAIRDEEITYVVVAGRYKLNFESLVKWSQQKTTVRNKVNTHGIGQFVDKWKIKNTLYSPSKKSLRPPTTPKE